MVSSSPIRVWVRSLGNSCRVRLENSENARWLLAQLQERNALVGLNQVEIHSTESGCRFQIPNATQRTLASLETALGQIPGVQLMVSPEAD